YAFNNFTTDSGKGYATAFGDDISKRAHKLANSNMFSRLHIFRTAVARLFTESPDVISRICWPWNFWL
ncbi:MAG: hypothetical protein IJZ53_09130, partial [Tyzzerella sp.]|nr:hypothetical protein [Tyzzerella sp.]